MSYLTRDIERAKTLLFRSLQEIERITKSDWLNVRGLPEFPLGFGYAEMAQLLDKGARAAYLLTVLRESPERLEIIRRESYGFLERQIIAQQERANQLDETSRQKAQEGLALSEQNERLAEECKGLYTKNVELAEECQRLDASGQALVNRIAALEQTLQELQNTEKARRQLILDRIDEYISTIRDITTSFSMKMAKVLQTVRHYRILGYSTPCSAITDVIYSIFSRRPLASNFGLLKATQDFWQDTISRYDALTPLTEEKVDIILQVDNFLNGGLENVVIEQACFFREQGKKVSILVLQQAGNSVLLAEGKHIHVICRRYTEDAYADLMRRLAPSAVFAHCSYNGAAICASLSIPFIQVVHNTYIWTRTYPECRQPILDAMPYTTKIVCVSELVRYFFNKEYQADNRKLVVIPNGIDLQRFRFSQRARVDIRNRYGIAPGTVLFLSVGSISEQKNYPAMIRALALALREAPNAKLLIIGHNYDQGIYEQMMAFAQENHIQDSIIYAGLVQNTEDYYAAADILLQSSFYEGCSLTILEGLACLCPFVAAATGTLALLDTIPRCHIVPTQIPLAELTMSRLHEKSDMFDRQFADAMIRAYKECDFSRLNISSEVREMFDQNLTYKQYLILLDTLLRHGDTQEFKNTSPLNWVDMIGTRRDCDLV
ncbi:MAG: glycosyltransferase [Bilophila wadsworthia]